MDVLRSAHTSTARVGSDNGRTAEIQWYKCAEGAKVFPAFHAFGNPVWEPHPDEWIRGPGVVTPLLRWAAKDIDAPPGQDYHGQLSWYQEGIPQAVLDDPEPYETEPCIVPRGEAGGGVRVGGSIAERIGGGVKVGGYMLGLPG